MAGHSCGLRITRVYPCVAHASKACAAVQFMEGVRDCSCLLLSVNGNRNLTSWRNVKTDQLRCSWFVGRSGDAAEVSVFEPVGVAFEGDDVGVVDEPVDHRGGDDLIAEHFAPAAERLVAGDDERGA